MSEAALDERRGGGERRQVADLQRELNEERQKARDARLESALAGVREKMAEHALKVETADERSEAALDLATRAETGIQTHERECVIRYQGIRDELQKVSGLPGAVVELASQVHSGKIAREQQHASTQERFDKQDRALEKQDEALKEIRDFVGATLGQGKSKLIALLLTGFLSACGAVVYLVAHYVLPAP